MFLHGDKSAFMTMDGDNYPEIFTGRRQTGDMSQELWSPGYFSAVLMKARDVTLVALDPRERVPMLALSPQPPSVRGRVWTLSPASEEIAHPAAREGLGAELVLAADQFSSQLLSAGQEHEARARAAGEKQVLTVRARTITGSPTGAATP